MGSTDVATDQDVQESFLHKLHLQDQSCERAEILVQNPKL